MKRSKALGERGRYNIMMARAVHGMAKIVMRSRPGCTKFSGLLEALVLEEYDRRRYKEDRSIAALMRENLNLKDRIERLKLHQKGLSGTLDLAEEDLKKARAAT